MKTLINQSLASLLVVMLGTSAILTSLSDLSLAGTRIQTADGNSVNIVDGDTLDIGDKRIRIENIDTPEVWPGQYKCDAERKRGLLATMRLTELVANKTVTYNGERMDRYDRLVAHVQIDGKDVGEILIAEGYAVRWAGRRHKWC